jgi:nucleoside-diphosphate-sugar epimerase
MKILCIGGTGLISTAISRQLLEQGHEVTLYNRGKSENRLPEGAAYTVIQGDRKDFATFESTFSDPSSTKYDIVVDMVSFHPDDTASAIRAFSGRCGQFLHCSTVCVVSGPPQTIPVNETEPYHSIGGYGKNKAAIEEMLLEAFAKDKFPATILRPSQTYGEGGSIIRPYGDWGSFGTFVDRLRKHKPVIVPGDGTNVWAACHVDDVAAGFIGTMGKEQCKGQVYNITGEENMTWNTYHEQVAEVVGGVFEPVYIPTTVLKEILPYEWVNGLWEIFAWPSIFDNSKIRRDAGWQGQTVSWRQGVKRTADWMEANGRISDSDSDYREDSVIATWRQALSQIPPFTN